MFNLADFSGDCLFPGGEVEALRRMREKVSQVGGSRKWIKVPGMSFYFIVPRDIPAIFNKHIVFADFFYCEENPQIVLSV